MLPIYLSIEGLYSYQGKQEIDFTRLTEAGLFGIFGKVGSGKSSIIEAISFALYGETERLNKQEKRTYNMLNLKSDAACIVFEFYNFQGRRFRFIAQWKRRKKFEDTTTLERLAYEWLNEEWIPLSSSDGTEITRLTYPNFRRTIIIPQGQFKEFLELKGKDRSDMMKEIFNLNRFDLGPKVAILQRKNNTFLEQIKGALSGFETVSLEVLKKKQDDLSNAQESLHQIKTETFSLEKELIQLSESKRIRINLINKQKEVDAYMADQPKIRQQEKDLQIYENTNLAFREILNHTHLLNKEKEQLTYKLEQLAIKKKDVLTRLEEKEEEWSKIANDYHNLDLLKAESEDLKLLIFIAQQQEQKKLLNKRLSDGQPHIQKVEKEEQDLILEIRTKESILDDLKNKKIDTTALLALETWYQQNDQLTIKFSELITQRSLFEKESAKAAEEFDRRQVALENWESILQQSETDWNTHLLSLQTELTQLKVNVKLSDFAENLVDGDPCPLCGALDHPTPMIPHDLSLRERELLKEQQDIHSALTDLKESFQILTRASIIWKDKQKQCEQLNSQILQIQEAQEQHLAIFQWEGFSATDKEFFLAYKNENQLLENTIRIMENELKELGIKATETQSKLEKYRSSLSTFEREILIKDSLIQQSESQLRKLKPGEFTNYRETALINRKKHLENRIHYLEDSYKSLTENINRLKTEFATVNGERSASKEQFQQLYQQLGARQSEISTLLVEHGYSDIIQVQQILQKHLNVPELRKTIQDFNVNLQTALNQVSDLQSRVTVDGFEETTYEEKTNLYSIKKEELEQQIRHVGALEKEYSHLQVEFAKKEKLIEEFQKVTLRKNNLNTLENLFRGAGFVNYVSSIHLKRLCEIANLRFHRLTKNNLSLTINESNEFEVIDFLNNGFKRSVKTLSGGQSFQASLSLALALAESIQSLNKAEKNFFFIDEGFGTQDAESMNIVFETLQYLHRENRIVGVISHVEELKERIPRAVTVTNDVEKGSSIHYHS
ncbi:AAA family ATPase [Sphingobacterium sp. LRF_L2]|uniref:AAA family ATPase n=1 Tax=Sphingobacterium sp. LRF_L2 TaxID=3369421 RepID=UPI003F618076